MNTKLTALLISLLLAGALSAQDNPENKAKKAKKKRVPAAMKPVKDTPGLPRVLLLGDSISIGYTVGVGELLLGKANVHRPLTNCGPTTKGVKELDKWLGDKPWDVIHFNFGLHDLKYLGPRGQNLADPKGEGSHQQVPLADYEKHLKTMVARLEKTGARLIWRSTTPVPPGARGRVVGDSAKYNKVAAKIMKERKITIDDMYSFCMPRLKEIMRPANVHFTPAGSKALAKQAVTAITAALKRRTESSGR
ncbi:MAG: SGNH/GDSL hydrolase family protein [Planctomycetes bacterium]|nr:SGNH/GDSL hydrolase family protein [Planctomycetota bacterium]